MGKTHFCTQYGASQYIFIEHNFQYVSDWIRSKQKNSTMFGCNVYRQRNQAAKGTRIQEAVMILKNHIIVSILAMEKRMPNLSQTVQIQWISSFCPDNNKSGFEKCVKIYINKPKINLLAFVLYNTIEKNRRHGWVHHANKFMSKHSFSFFFQWNQSW